jgi:hypothetical protein
VALVTALLRDLGYFIRSARVWPIIRETLDWGKVEALLAAEGAATPEAQPLPRTAGRSDASFR